MSRIKILLLLVVAAVTFAVYVIARPNLPPGVETKGDVSSSPMIAYISLVTSVASLLTAILGLVKEYRGRKKDI
jgi:hypothetical protein